MKDGRKASTRSWGGWRNVGCGLLAMAFCAGAFAADPAPKPKPKPASAEAPPPCDPKAAAEIVVLNDILQPKERVVPVGPNNFGDPGGGAVGMNNFIKNSGDEPANSRHLWRVKQVGDGWIELDWMGTRNWKTWGDGFLSGATARFYRLADAEGKSLPRVPDKDPATSYIDIAKAHHVLPLGHSRVLPVGSPGHAKGGWVANDNEQRVYLEAKAPALEIDDYVIFEKSFAEINVATIDASKEVSEVGYSWRQAAVRGADMAAKLRFSLVAHPKPVPEAMADPGATCLRVDVPAGKQTMEQGAAYGGAADFWYANLEPGKKYRFEAWMRQEGLGDGGKVTFGATDSYAAITSTFTVDGQWKKHTYDFVGPQRAESKKLMANQITFTGPGTLWMDNARIFRYDSEADLAAAFVPGRTNVEELVASSPPHGPKGALRCWAGLSNQTMERVLSLHANSGMDIRKGSVSFHGNSKTIPMGLLFAEATGASPSERVTPWLIIQVTFSEEEYQALIEYLAEPYDPAKDSPQAKPWAFKRYQQRGKGEPWTEAFPRIFIEFGNENWHNRMMPDWIGFGRAGHVHTGGKEYGIVCQYYIDTMKKTPCWSARRLDDRIKFILGGNYTSSVAEDGTISGYGPDAMSKCPDAMGQGHATYVGAKWELNEDPMTELNDEGFQKTLLSYELWAKGAMENQSKARARLMELGRQPFDLVGYEGGPSGFLFSARPGKDKKTFPEEAIKSANVYGHSQCIGIAALDSWLDACRLGWTWMCYLSWGQGNVNWTSHTVMGNGYRPYAGWQAMALRNRYIWGDMLKVDVKSAPTLSYRTASKGAKPVARAVNLVSAYAFRDGTRYAVALLSRKLDGKHDGFDLGDGCTPVTLRLPFAKAGKIELHALVGDPRKTNHEALNSKIESKDIAASGVRDGVFVVNDKTGGAAGGLPPGQAFVYVFEASQ